MQHILLLALVSLCSCASIRDQAVGVFGRLMCGDKPAVNVTVKLWEEDIGPDPDDLLDEGYTDKGGEFKLQVTESELTNIDPVFKVYHDCNDEQLPGLRKVRFRIPSQYIASGKTPTRLFHIGVLNLETIFAEEERRFL
ncbi:unnamed protein product [Cylicocyclus nassatus]|uniref:Transthyretin-like family protein n=1 Tax=Cylicocyclus nassatus TaxID=53992 RepID=A0AA36H3S2_CYLNA|nr:unnamed protein product [Cylicocyclus nassatus]